ncbi:MAG: hypothetical protein U0903_10155 [Planctomycetales bacterium]
MERAGLQMIYWATSDKEDALITSSPQGFHTCHSGPAAAGITFRC